MPKKINLLELPLPTFKPQSNSASTPQPNQQFSQLALRNELVTNLPSLGYQQMTAIQSAALPVILDGQDVIAQAPTGSGKTVAFGLGVLQAIQVEKFAIQALLLCPTRELADQVATELRRLARAMHNLKVLTLCGGQPFGPQALSLQHGAHILVGTPGRLEDHLRRGNLQLEQVKLLVLDEADRMLDMGFHDSLTNLVAAVSTQRQTLLFSATFPPQIEQLAADFLRQPQRLAVAEAVAAPKIQQHFYRLENEQQRFNALQQLLLHFNPATGVVFCTRRQETQELADNLNKAGFNAQALHGDMEQKDRDATLIQFANQSLNLLVATDVAARGLDIAKVEAVFNYQLALDPEVHVHRVGRTGRAGQAGLACTLVSPAEGQRLANLAAYLQQDLQLEAVPTAKPKVKPQPAPMRTLQIDGGKKAKLRPGDLLGALTAQGTLHREDIGAIKITAQTSYVAVARHLAPQALQLLNAGIKGRKFRARYL